MPPLLLLRVYRLLLHAYPREFRRRFSQEMSQVFRDSLRGAAPMRGLPHFLLVSATDLLLGALRERIASMRTSDPLAGPAQHAVDGVPVFYIFEDEIPRRSALINGGFLAIGVFAFVSFLIGHGGAPHFFLIGSHHPSPSHMLPAYTEALADSELDSVVKTTPYPDPIPIAPYFRLILVLAALDTDQNNVISEWEIANAAPVLRALARDHQGRLLAEQCGFHAPETNVLDPDLSKRLRLAFMRTHPVLALLDANYDGEISAAEISNAPSRLKLLDHNRDGRLTLDEVLPDPFESTAVNLTAAFDRDGDGRLSAEEIVGVGALNLRNSLSRADKDKDGYVTGDELRKAMLAGELETIRPRPSLPIPTR